MFLDYRTKDIGVKYVNKDPGAIGTFAWKFLGTFFFSENAILNKAK